MPLIFVGRDRSYAIDGTYGSEVIFIKLDDLNSPDVLKILGHELRYLNNYDIGQNTADNVRGKIKVSVNPTNTNGKYDDYLASFLSGGISLILVWNTEKKEFDWGITIDSEGGIGKQEGVPGCVAGGLYHIQEVEGLAGTGAVHGAGLNIYQKH